MANANKANTDVAVSTDEDKFALARLNAYESQVTEAQLDDDQLREMSFDDLLNNVGPEAFLTSADIGDGHALLKDKDVLVDREFIATQWRFVPGDFGTPFVVVHCTTRENDKYIFVDGSTGVATQLANITSKLSGRTTFFHCKHGLRKSEYMATVDGREIPATTYYIDTAV